MGGFGEHQLPASPACCGADAPGPGGGQAPPAPQTHPHSLPMGAARGFKGIVFVVTSSFPTLQSQLPAQLSLRYNQAAKKGSKRAEIGECPKSPECVLVPTGSFPSPNTDEEKPPRNHVGPFNSICTSCMPAEPLPH